MTGHVIGTLRTQHRAHTYQIPKFYAWNYCNIGVNQTPKKKLPYDLAIPLLGMYTQENWKLRSHKSLYTNVQSSIIQNS